MLLFFIPGIWVVLLLYAVSKHSFFRIDPISNKYVYGAFLFKLLLGFGNYYIWLQIIGHGDSLRYYHDSLIVYNSLFDNPLYYFELLTRTSLENVPAYLHPYQHELFIEWHVKEYNMVRLMAVLNLFTFGNVWGNIVILGFIGFAASIALFKAITHLISSASQHQKPLFLLIFFLPSLIFWTGGLLKEAPVFILLSIIAVQLLNISAKPLSAKDLNLSLLKIFIAICLLYFIRDYVAIFTIINIVIYTVVIKFKAFKKKPFLAFTCITISLLAAGIIITLVLPQFNYMAYLKSEQSYFLSGSTDPDYTFKIIGDSSIELIKMIPYAINNILFRPNIINSSELFRVYQSVELIFIWILIGLLIFRLIKHKINLSSLAILFLFLGMELLFVYGLMVTDADTLSRYRSIPLFFIILWLGIHQPAWISKKLASDSNTPV